MPEGDLRTRISVDTEGAAAEFDKLTEKAQQLRIQEAASQEKMVRDLSTMTVEEFDKQIKAEERLLERLRIKQINDADDVRSKLVEQYAQRKEEHERRIRELDTEAIKIRALGDESVEQQEKLRKVIKDRNDEMAKAREDEIKGLQEIAGRTRELHVAAPGGVPGAAPGGLEAAGGAAEMGQFAMMATMMRTGGASMQKALAPLMRILGPVGIAFSLEQVVEKLYKANEELRVIRNNYADIAATMGDLVGVGGLFAGTAQASMIQLQRSFADQFADAFDEKIIPSIAAVIQRSGVPTGALAGLTETAALMGMGAGVAPQTIGGYFARLFFEFRVPLEELAEETALMVEAGHNVRITFEDLSKWTLTLAEQTRVYGFDVADSRRLITEFASEIAEGTVQMSDLVQVQKSMATLNLSASMGIVQFIDQIGNYMSGFPGFPEAVRAVGGDIERGLLIEAIGQGQMPLDVMRHVAHDERLGEAWGKFFDIETGVIREDVGRDIGAELLRGIRGASLEFAEATGGGPAMQDHIMFQILKMFGLDLTGKPIATQNRILQGIEDKTISLRDAMKELETPAAKTVDELVAIGRGLALDRATITGKISTGIKWWWRDAAGDLGLLMRRAFGGELEDVRAQIQRGGGGARAISATGIEVEGGRVLSIAEIAQAGRSGAIAAGDDFKEGLSGFKDLIQHLITEGRIEGVTDIGMTNAIARYFFNIGVAPDIPPYVSRMGIQHERFVPPVVGTPEEQVTGFRREYLEPQRQERIQELTNDIVNALIAGQLGDVSRQRGVQIEMGDIQINLSGYKNIGEVNQAIDDKLDVVKAEVKAAVEEALNKDNMEATQ